MGCKSCLGFHEIKLRAKEDLSLTNLSKLTMLLVLTVATIVSSIQPLNFKCMAVAKDLDIFHVHKLQKTSREGKSLISITYHACPHDTELCAVDALKEYILKTF